MLNYTSRPHDVLTMAHELGHGVHAALARPAGHLPLLHAADARRDRLDLRREHRARAAARAGARRRPSGSTCSPGALDGAVAAVFRQIAMNRFEHAIHTERREAGELSVERFAELWLATQGDLLGDSVELDDDYGIWWSYIWHFIDAPGYVYAYAYGHLLALSVYRKYEEQGDGFVSSYLDLLRAGGSRPPEELGAIVGVDLSDPGFWSAGPRAGRAPARRRRGRRPGGGANRVDRRADRAARRRGRADAPARRRGADHRGGVRARGVPPLLGGAVVERRRARARRLAPLAARQADARAGLRARAAEHRRRAGGRPRARHGLVAGGRRRPRRPTRSATAWRSRRCAAPGPSRTRSSSAGRGRSCSRATCSTRRATWSCCSTCCRGSWTDTGLVLLADPGRVPAERFLAAAGEQGWTIRSIASPRAPRVLIHRLRRRTAPLDDLEVAAAAVADLVGGLKRGLEQCGRAALARRARRWRRRSGATGSPPAPIGRRATSRIRSAMRATVVASCTPAHTAASRSSSSWPTRSSGRSAELMWRPISRRTTLVAGRPRSSTRRSRPSIRITIDARGAGAGRMERPGEAVEQGEARGQPGGGVDLGRGLRLRADEVEPAGDPLHLGLVARDEGGLDGAPAAAGGQQAVLDGLGARAAHPAAVERHDALAVLRVDQRLHRAADQRVARHAGELGDERRGVAGRTRRRRGRRRARARCPASSRKRCSHGSCAKPLPSTALRCRFGTPTLRSYRRAAGDP